MALFGGYTLTGDYRKCSHKIMVRYSVDLVRSWFADPVILTAISEAARFMVTKHASRKRQHTNMREVIQHHLDKARWGTTGLGYTLDCRSQRRCLPEPVNCSWWQDGGITAATNTLANRCFDLHGLPALASYQDYHFPRCRNGKWRNASAWQPVGQSDRPESFALTTNGI